MTGVDVPALNPDMPVERGLASAETLPIAGEARDRLPPVLRPLRDRDFRLLWAGESISLLGDQFHYVALSWLILQLTGSGLALGTVLVAAAIPRAILMLVGGAFADRFSPRSIIAVSNALRGVVVAAATVLILTNSIEVWHLVILGVVFGTVDAFFYPAVNTIVPMLVSVERLPAANAVHQGTSQLMALIGPAVAGVMIAAVGTGAAFSIDAGTFLVATLAAIALRGGRRVPGTSVGGGTQGTEGAAGAAGADRAVSPDVAPPEGSFLATIRAGARYAWGDPAIRALVILTAAFNLALTGPVAVGLPWLAANRFEGGSAALGFMLAGFGTGALIGAILAGSLPRPRRLGSALVVVAAVLGLGIGLAGFLESVTVAVPLFAVMGLAAGWVNVTIIAWLQGRIEASVLGRVMGLVMFGSVGLAPVSLAAAGVLVDLDATLMFVAASVVVLAAVAVGLLTGSFGRIRDPEPA